ncbi:flavodoxin family protein [Spirochaetia bacterium]|nr:flavodoxin family protein [Spirochaetia bacterium]
MSYLIISGSPKKGGLCHTITEEVRRGAVDGGEQVEILTVEKLERCHVCGTGWGSCRENHVCAFGDDGFTAAQNAVRAAGQLCFITPVYWSEMAESLKCFFDRLRRCEFDMPWQPRPEGQPASLSGKQVLLIASPGGSGNGMISCLDQMDRFCRHTGAVIFDYIGINRWNNDYKRQAVYAAAKAMAGGRKAGETL